jgi:hypothetical protein
MILYAKIQAEGTHSVPADIGDYRKALILTLVNMMPAQDWVEPP